MIRAYSATTVLPAACKDSKKPKTFWDSFGNDVCVFLACSALLLVHLHLYPPLPPPAAPGLSLLPPPSMVIWMVPHADMEPWSLPWKWCMVPQLANIGRTMQIVHGASICWKLHDHAHIAKNSGCAGACGLHGSTACQHWNQNPPSSARRSFPLPPHLLPPPPLLPCSWSTSTLLPPPALSPPRRARSVKRP